MPVSAPAPDAAVLQQAMRELCKPRSAIHRAADAALVAGRFLLGGFRQGGPVRIEVHIDPDVEAEPVVLEIPRECIDLDWRGRPRELRGPIARVQEPFMLRGRDSFGLPMTAPNGWHELRARPNKDGDFVYPEERLFPPDRELPMPLLVPDTKQDPSGRSLISARSSMFEGLWLSWQRSTVLGHTTSFYLTHRVHVLAEKWIGRPVRLSPKGPVVIEPHSDLSNSSYAMRSSTLRLGVAWGPATPGAPLRVMEDAKVRRSVAHELGHGLHGVLQPYLAEASGRFIREAFADLVVLFDQLDDSALRERWLAETGGQLWQSSTFTRTGDELKAIGAGPLRDVFNDLTVSDVDFADANKHEASVVVSGAMLRILSNIHGELVASGQKPEEALRLAYEALSSRWMAATEILPNHFLEPRDVGRALIAVEKQLGGVYLDVMQRELLRRELLAPEDLGAAAPSLADRLRTETGGKRLSRRQAQRFLIAHAAEVGIDRPWSLKVDEVLTTITGGQLIRFQLTEYEGQKSSPFRNRGALVTDSSGNLIFQHRPLPPDFTSQFVSPVVQNIHAWMRENRATSVLITRRRGSKLIFASAD